MNLLDIMKLAYVYLWFTLYRIVHTEPCSAKIELFETVTIYTGETDDEETKISTTKTKIQSIAFIVRAWPIQQWCIVCVHSVSHIVDVWLTEHTIQVYAWWVINKRLLLRRIPTVYGFENWWKCRGILTVFHVRDRNIIIEYFKGQI